MLLNMSTSNEKFNASRVATVKYKSLKVELFHRLAFMNDFTFTFTFNEFVYDFFCVFCILVDQSY